MATRQKKTIVSGVSREAADDAFAVYAQSEAKIKKISAEIELQCAKTREKYMDELAQLTTERDQAFETLQAFATEQKAELFSRKKSLEMSQGTIGFRTGTPKLKTLKGFTWAAALELVKRSLPGYVRTTVELAKDKLLADRDMDAVVCSGDDVVVSMVEAMKGCGIQVVQDETFYVEAKNEDNL